MNLSKLSQTFELSCVFYIIQNTVLLAIYYIKIKTHQEPIYTDKLTRLGVSHSLLLHQRGGAFRVLLVRPHQTLESGHLLLYGVTARKQRTLQQVLYKDKDIRTPHTHTHQHCCTNTPQSSFLSYHFRIITRTLTCK